MLRTRRGFCIGETYGYHCKYKISPTCRSRAMNRLKIVRNNILLFLVGYDVLYVDLYADMMR